jgi:hypothetical protein
MLKRDDPIFDALIKDIKKVVSERYLEDQEAPISGIYKRAGAGGSGEEFGALRWRAREDVICAFVTWDEYQERGITYAQVSTIIVNVLHGKPQEKWLEGVFDEAVLENQKNAGFKASVEDRKNSPDNHVFDEMEGGHNPWVDLSAAAKLQYIALDAARHDVLFEPFAEAVKETIGDAGTAALRVVLDCHKELHAIAKLFPDDGRTEPTPVVEQVKEMLDYLSALEGKPPLALTERTDPLTEKAEAMFNGQQRLEKLTTTDLKEESQKLPAEKTPSSAADRSKDIER